jgi:signal transduction histidine kinase
VTSSDESHGGTEDGLLAESIDDLYDHAPCGYLSTRPDGTIANVNQTLLDWIGRTREALLSGTKFQTLLTIGSKIYYETHYAPLVQMQGFANGIALDLVCDDGRILPVIVNSRQRRDAGGAALFNRITLFDSTDRKRYERELLLARRNADRAASDKASLLAMLSHDIRNPLNAIMGVIQLLDRSELTDKQRRLVRLLKSSSDNMLNLLEHVLELSRAESSGFALVETRFSVPDLVDDVVSTFQARAREKQLELRWSVDPRVPQTLLGDPVAIRQILTNLVANAVKFTEAGRVEITIQVDHLASDAVTLTFAVSDTGVGIAPEVVEHIFDEFTQASYETGMKFGGTGLGLTITRKLLALHGSAVRLASVPGEGSTFTFSLRLGRPPD